MTLTLLDSEQGFFSGQLSILLLCNPCKDKAAIHQKEARLSLPLFYYFMILLIAQQDKAPICFLTSRNPHTVISVLQPRLLQYTHGNEKY